MSLPANRIDFRPSPDEQGEKIQAKDSPVTVERKAFA
jgi:hypothetical protein